MLQPETTESIIDAEFAWREFVKLVARVSAGGHERYTRINPGIRQVPPRFDAYSESELLVKKVKEVLERTAYQREVQRVACNLVASSFYYSSTSPPTLGSDDHYICTAEPARFYQLLESLNVT